MKTIFVTSFTTSSALLITALSNIIAIKCFAVFAGTLIFVNYFYTITWLPCLLVIHDKYFQARTDKLHLKLLGSVSVITKVYKCISFIPNIFFKVCLPKLITALHTLWIALFLLVGISGFVATFVFPKLKFAEGSEFQFLRNSHPFEKYDQEYKPNLAFENSEGVNFNLVFIWGLLPTTDTNKWDPSDFGNLEFDPNFSFGSNDTQMWLEGFCNDIHTQSFLNLEDGSNFNFCFIDEFREWMNSSCSPAKDRRCCEISDFPFSRETFNYCVVQFTFDLCGKQLCFNFLPGLRFDRNNSIKVMFLQLESSVKFSLRFSPVDEFWKSVSSFTDDQLSRAPIEMRGGWAYSQMGIQLPFYDLQQGLSSSTTATIAVSLATAVVVLVLATRDICISFFATLTITFIVFATVGCLVLIGWELNIFESITFTLAVGLAIDYTVHYSVAYTFAPFPDRKRRTLYAIEVLAPPVAVAAVSTCTAGAIMFKAVVRIYVQFGTFLVTVISLSWLFSLFFLLSLCYAVGPNGNVGKLSLENLSKLFMHIRNGLKS